MGLKKAVSCDRAPEMIGIASWMIGVDGLHRSAKRGGQSRPGRWSVQSQQTSRFMRGKTQLRIHAPNL